MKVKRENLAYHLWKYQLSLIGRTEEDVERDDRWKFNFSLTREEYQRFHRWALREIMKTLHVPKSKAYGIFEYYWLLHGVHLKG